LTEKQIRIVRQGICVDDLQSCLICDIPLISLSANFLKRIKVFECKHSFHDECILQQVFIMDIFICTIKIKILNFFLLSIVLYVVKANILHL
jgi:hypothetical protein